MMKNFSFPPLLLRNAIIGKGAQTVIPLHRPKLSRSKLFEQFSSVRFNVAGIVSAKMMSIYIGYYCLNSLLVMAARDIDTLVSLVFSALIFASVRKQLAGSRTDFLTGLLNRQGLHDFKVKIERNLSHTGRWISIVAIDVDNFKTVNDSFGHSAGDQILKTISGIIKASVRRGDCSIRTGGDEFIIIMQDASPRSCKLVARRIQRKIRAQMDCPCSVSMGALSVWGRRFSFDKCLQEADRLLYRAKANGRNEIAFDSIEASDFSQCCAASGNLMGSLSLQID